MEERQLERLDNRGYPVLDAITYSRPPPGGSHASPHAFVCVDGRTYWVKRRAQQGLAVELIAGRLGVRTGAAPDARIVNVRQEVLPPDGSANDLVGLGVGTHDQPGMENVKDLGSVLPGGQIDPGKIDTASRLRVLCFQSWLGVQDTQVLVDLRDGRLMSIDHGDWGGNLAHVPPSIIPTPGVPADFGRNARFLRQALRRILEVTDEELLDAVARVPVGAEWNSEPSRRLELGRWIAWRRDGLRGVMEAWQRGA